MEISQICMQMCVYLIIAKARRVISGIAFFLGVVQKFFFPNLLVLWRFSHIFQLSWWLLLFTAL